jgi:catechol-2,3-dioxygenase
MASTRNPGVTAPITALSHVQLMVSDVRTSAEWYTTVLSLVPYAHDFELGYVALRQPGARMVLVLTERAGADASVEAGKGALDHMAFAVSDGEALHAWAEHLAGLGVEHAGVVLENGRPSLQLRDPDGIAIELVA